MSFESKWITEKIDKDCIDFAEKLGKELKDGKFTTSQFRNIYGELKRIQMAGYAKEEVSFLLLKPKMAYAVKRMENRDNAEIIKKFHSTFDQAYKAVVSGTAQLDEQGKRFDRLCSFMEAVLAYHKSFGGN